MGRNQDYQDYKNLKSKDQKSRDPKSKDDKSKDQKSKDQKSKDPKSKDPKSKDDKSKDLRSKDQKSKCHKKCMSDCPSCPPPPPLPEPRCQFTIQLDQLDPDCRNSPDVFNINPFLGSHTYYGMNSYLHYRGDISPDQFFSERTDAEAWIKQRYGLTVLDYISIDNFMNLISVGSLENGFSFFDLLFGDRLMLPKVVNLSAGKPFLGRAASVIAGPVGKEIVSHGPVPVADGPGHDFYSFNPTFGLDLIIFQ